MSSIDSNDPPLMKKLKYMFQTLKIMEANAADTAAFEQIIVNAIEYMNIPDNQDEQKP
jgi:hypothetical protein